MRTTLTLEPDVARKIQSKIKQNGKGLKEVINEALRLGLLEQEKMQSQPRKPFKVMSFSGKPRKNFNFDKPWSVIQEVEGPRYK
jgi:hypothetical protein